MSRKKKNYNVDVIGVDFIESHRDRRTSSELSDGKTTQMNTWVEHVPTKTVVLYLKDGQLEYRIFVGKWTLKQVNGWNTLEDW